MKTSVAFVALSMAATCACTSVRADETDLEHLDDLVITTSLVPQQRDRVTQSVTIITREDIERRQAIHVADLLREVPGVAVSRSGAVGSQTQVRIRGAEANHVLVMIDGVEANDPASGDEFRFEHLLTADVERIEIVRGPQSALWGTDALAGVVHIITRSGHGRSGGSAFLEAGSDDTLNGGANLDLGSGPLRGHVGVTRFDTEGSNISRQGNEDDGADATTFTARMRTEWEDQGASLDGLFRYVDAHADIDATDFVTTGLPVDADLGNDVTRAYGLLRGTLANPNGRLDQSLAVTWLDTQNDNLALGEVTASSDADKLGLRYQANYAITPSQRLTGALDYEETDFSQRGQAQSFGDPNQDQRIDTLGLVMEYVGFSQAGWDWSLGVRHENHSDFEDATTYQGALAYAFSDRARIRLAAGTGRKAPTLTERFGFFPDVFIGNPNLEPEESTSIELGYEWAWADGSVGLTVFDQDLKNEINGFVFDPDTLAFTAANEAGESHRSGAELAARWSPAPGWALSAHYTYTDATERRSGTEVDELRRPRHRGGVNLDYLTLEDRLNVNLNASYNGARDDVFFPPFPDPMQTEALDGYVLVDLAGRYRLRPDLELFARLKNLTDEDYEDVFGFATPGRTVMAGVRYHFGQ